MVRFCGTRRADASRTGSDLDHQWGVMSDTSGFRPLREVIVAHGLGAKHSLGQHFLLDTNLTARIVRAAGDLAGRNVIEVGPGPGGLTRALLESDAARIVAIELDRRAIGAIDELAAVSDGRLTVMQADALRVDLPDLVPPPRQIIANLPYNVASPLLVRWLRQASAFERMTLMFQREVAERIVAAPGTDAYGRLSVLAGWTPHPEQPEPALFAAMERLTAAAFGQRRKMLRGALKPLGGEALLTRAGIVGDRRAETLSVAEFDRLARLL
jgi:16S rRNA (adenine1518-N6/adenine1519-N6)-dimethyltransferase